MLLSYCAKVDHHTFSLFILPSFVLESDRNKSGSFLFLLMTTDEIRTLIREGRTADFYNDWQWRRLAHKVMHDQHYECQYCKARGRYTRARFIHHVNHLKEHPELAYQEYYIDSNGETKRNLIACCHMCHEAQHPERFRHGNGFTNEERW